MNFAEPLNANRYSNAEELLSESVRLAGVTGERPSRAALDAAARICAGDLLSSIFFMNKIHPGWKARHHLSVPNSRMKVLRS